MPPKLMASARELIAAGKLSEAEQLLRTSQDPWARIHLADLLLLRAPFDEKKVDEACALYEAASDDLPQLAAASIDRARAMLASAPDVLVEKLQEHFGYASFRSGQREVVQAVLKGRHALAIMPTGKSILHELPAVMLEGETIRVGRAMPPGDLTQAAGRNVDLLVVEDAQRVSEWSPDFSTEYLKLRDAILHVRPKAVLALAPFAAPRVRVEILERLSLQNPYVHVASIDRPNVFLAVERAADRVGALIAAIRSTPGHVLVYARQDRDEVAERIRSAGIPVTTDPTLWHRGVLVVDEVFDTNFREIRAVFHLHYPESLEQYYAEILCVARDGQPATAGVFYDPEDKNFHRARLDERFPSREAAAEALAQIREGRTVNIHAAELLERHGIVRRTSNGFEPAPGAPSLQRVDLSEMERRRGFTAERLRAMEGYLEGRACRRRALLEYFGEKLAPAWRCAGCDRCRAGASQETEVRTPEARQAILDSVRELESRRMTLNQMARAILFLGKPLKGVTETDVREILTQLIKDGVVEVVAQGQWLKLGRRP